MLEFVPGPHRETVTDKQKQHIAHCFRKGSHSYMINLAYNNAAHFSSFHNQYNITQFLKEIDYLINSKEHKIQVMGGIHSDPFGHSSNMIGQVVGFGEFYPAIVQDTYIRFNVLMDPKNPEKLQALDSVQTYHYLIEPPTLVKLQQRHNIPVYVYFTHIMPSPGHYTAIKLVAAH